jgi:hypothetical protein
MTSFFSLCVLGLALVTFYSASLCAALREDPDMALSSASHPLPTWEGRLKNWRERLDAQGALSIPETRLIIETLETDFEELQREQATLQRVLHSDAFSLSSRQLVTNKWSRSLPPNPDMRGQFSLYRKIFSAFHSLAQANEQLRTAARSLRSVAATPESSPPLSHPPKKPSSFKWPKKSFSSKRNHHHNPYK